MQKAVNGQTIIELLAKHLALSSEKKEEVYFNTDEELVKWSLYFDGVSVRMLGGVGPTGRAAVVLVVPLGKMHLHS